MDTAAMAVTLGSILRGIASGMKYPVFVSLIILGILTMMEVGGIVAEFLAERRRLRVKMPALVDALKKHEVPTAKCVESSGILRRQKRALIELTLHPELTDAMRESLAVRLLEEEEQRLGRIVKQTDMIAKLGPILGLLGTLIPLGPGIIALGQGDTLTLAESLLTAFDTTVVGLTLAAVAMVISSIRRGWYKNYMSIQETLTDCILEVEKNGEDKE